ncbi:hypothetical protein LAZ67_13000652 [Cordylochernes scorpioides]|uniref:Uncharacterized protein n=1 Tax=Cordylochernes scorpioides TaxID=51811 RepID=A0ABY6L364_9ARAC|nr:hypothetical protein LAZ67_13000652 [Cordylochernes scorpioides]
MYVRRLVWGQLENSFCGDKLVSHGGLCRGREYKEERVYKEGPFDIRFYFITKVLGDYIFSLLEGFRKDPPDIIIVNSCIWDITRWGPLSIDRYKANLPKFFSACREILSPNTLLIWLTAPPISSSMRSALLVGRLEFLTPCLRFHVVQANHYAKKVPHCHYCLH